MHLFCFLRSHFGTREKAYERQIISQVEASTEHPLEIIRNCQTAHERLHIPEVFKFICLLFCSESKIQPSQWSSIHTCRNAAGLHLLEFWWKREGWLAVLTALASFKHKSRHCSPKHNKILRKQLSSPPRSANWSM